MHIILCKEYFGKTDFKKELWKIYVEKIINDMKIWTITLKMQKDTLILVQESTIEKSTFLTYLHNFN